MEKIYYSFCPLKIILFFFLQNLNAQQLENIISTMEIFDIATENRSLVFQYEDHFEAPNWTPDGSYLIYNSHGKLVEWDLENEKLKMINSGDLVNLNNDHGISPDGKYIVISNNEPRLKASDYLNGSSRIYILPRIGGKPRLITNNAPSYWHSWSPDQKTLVFVAKRNADFNIYTVPFEGGEEVQITNDKGLDDGPDYSPDGKYIYYNSYASGSMENI